MSTTHSDRTHAELGGSNANRWTNCPGSVALSRQLPAQESTEAADQGTFMHELAEPYLEGWLAYRLYGDKKAWNGIRKIIASRCEEGKKRFEHVDFEHIESYRQAVWDKVLDSEITNKAFGFEDRFVLNKQLGMSGLIDFWVAYVDDSGKKTLAIVDYKYGYYPVEAKKNFQLLFYACAAQTELGRKKPFEKIRTIIYQPRVDTPYKEEVYTAKQIESYRQRFMKAAHSIYVEKSKRLKTGSWCTFCPAQAICPKYSQQLSAETALKFVQPDKIQLPALDRVPDDIIARLVDRKGDIEKFLKGIDRFILDRARAGLPVKGVKIVHTKPRRKWIDDEKRIIKGLKQCGLEEKEITKKSLLPLGTVEKLLDGGPETIAPFVEMTKPSLVVAPSSDPRKAVKLKDLRKGFSEPAE